ncbi:hypothetical protein GGX14DRAFT_651379 [Mycena pura]|uniref:F-box domain-containing protein n=1 Tax=Mycena pura TaxID=153505 RepID=A0AAD6YNS4_9AGAR|nr:hypothetical protein GGX14DRAFT_651379 [Mycena pura]
MDDQSKAFESSECFVKDLRMCHEQDETASDGLAPGPLSTDASAAFPSELHDYTIDFLHNDRASLCACSLVCKSWTASSQYHLFKNATIRVWGGNFSQFCEELVSTHLNIYVGRLYLTCDCDGDWGVDEPRDWNAEFEAQLSRLKPLSCLEYLRLSYDNGNQSPSIPSAIGPNFSSIVDLELTATWFASIAEIFQSCIGLPHLRRLALVSTERLEDEDASVPDLPMLDTFAVDALQNLEVILRWLPSQPSIRRIAIGCLHSEDIHLLDIMLRTLGPRLEHLIIEYSNDCVSDLSHVTALRTLEIVTFLSDGSFLNLPALLEKLPGHARALQRIVFVLDNVKDWNQCLDWSHVGPILASLDSLQHVEFHVRPEERASQIIHEHLASRKYALRVQGLTDRLDHECSLSKFDC